MPDELFPLIDIMKPNEKELSILTGMPTETDEEIKAAADALIEKGVSKVVVTLGARGAMLADGNEKLFFVSKAGCTCGYNGGRSCIYCCNGQWTGTGNGNDTGHSHGQRCGIDCCYTPWGTGFDS